jgi:hypothetical protein
MQKISTTRGLSDLASAVGPAKLGLSPLLSPEHESLVRKWESILELYVQHLPATEMRLVLSHQEKYDEPTGMVPVICYALVQLSSCSA